MEYLGTNLTQDMQKLYAEGQKILTENEERDTGDYLTMGWLKMMVTNSNLATESVSHQSLIQKICTWNLKI